jgi:Prp8 binding protein
MDHSNKRARYESGPSASTALSLPVNSTKSSLAAPNLALTGHQAAVYSLSFSPTGAAMASGSFDKTILLWNVGMFCDNYNVLAGFKNAVTQTAWSRCGRDYIYGCSADKTVQCFDGTTGDRIKRYTGHTGVVNTLSLSSCGNMVVSGSDDRTVRLHDIRVSGGEVSKIDAAYQVASVALSQDDATVYFAGIDNVVYGHDVRTGEVSLTLKGHTDTVTGLAVSPDGTKLLSNGMDNALMEWDINPFCSEPDRCIKVFTGHCHSAEKRLLRCSWSKDGEMVSCGTADKTVRIWDEPTGEELYSLPGHKGGVQDVVFHPTMPVIASASSDKTIILGEL